MSVLIAAAFVLSAWWWVWIAFPDGPFISVHAGAIEFRYPSAETWAGYMRHGAGLRFALVGTTFVFGFILPLVYPFLAVAVPTLIVWRFGRKPVKPGHCRCGYNLTGLTEARCPECGQAL